MTTFSDLPPDILLDIVPYIPFESVLLLRTLSSFLSSTLSPIAFRNIRIPGSSTLFQNTSPETVVNFISTACAFPLGLEGTRCIFENARRVTVWIPICAERCDLERLDGLWRFLRRLGQGQGVREVRLRSAMPPTSTLTSTSTTAPSDLGVCQWWNRIVQCILPANPTLKSKSELCRIESLDMEIPMADLSLYVSPLVDAGLTNLRSIRIKFDRYPDVLPQGYYRPLRQDFGSFRRLVQMNADGLENLELDDGFGLRFSPPRSICDFLPPFQDSNEPNSGSTNVAMPCMRGGLRSLTLSCIRIGPDISSSISHIHNLRHIRYLSTYSHFPANDLWAALRYSGIYLESLETHQISSPLLEYLSSYTGLQSLKIFELNGTPPPLEPFLCFGTQFIQEVLPKHANTLKILCLNESRHKWLDYSSDWLFNDSWPLKSLTALRVLRISPTRKRTAFLQEQYQHVLDLIEEAGLYLDVLEVYLPKSVWDDSIRDQVFRVKSAVDGLRVMDAKRVRELKVASGVYRVEKRKEGREGKSKEVEAFERMFERMSLRGGWRFTFVEGV